MGSFLRSKICETGNADIWTVDSQVARLEGIPQSRAMRYQDLTTDFLRQFDAILWFAGHSNVKSCIYDPVGALKNNCSDLLELIYKKADRTKFIYASTASVYSKTVAPNEAVQISKEHEAMASPETVYDASKVAFDSLISVIGKNIVGLRMGTICGWGPCLRPELIFNAMNLSALETHKLWVSNPKASRTLLFLEDLNFYVNALINSASKLPQLLNVGSFNLTIGEIAASIAKFHAVPIEEVEATPTYSFNMDLQLLHSSYGVREPKTLHDHCVDFTTTYQNQKDSR